jgi:hypothetical protein
MAILRTLSLLSRAKKIGAGRAEKRQRNPHEYIVLLLTRQIGGGRIAPMAIMLSKTYTALKSAGASEEEAMAAAEELAAYEHRLASIDNRLGRIETHIQVLTWAVGVNAAATIAILGALLHGLK